MAKTFKIFSLFFIFIPLAAHAQSCPGTVPTGIECIAASASKQITAFAVCANITNTHVSGKALMVPVKTSAEWSKFRTSLPAGITSSACGCVTDWADMPNTLSPGVASTGTITICGITSAIHIQKGGIGAGNLWYRKNGGSLISMDYSNTATLSVVNGDTIEFRASYHSGCTSPNTYITTIRKENSTGAVMDTFQWYGADNLSCP